MRVLVVGAGLAGLAAAAFLGRSGCNVSVVERSVEAATEGAGIQVSPNASHVLRALGVLDAAMERAVAPEAIELLDGPTGRLLSRFELGAGMVDRYGAPYLLIERSALRDILLQCAMKTADIRFGTTLNAWEDRKDTVRADLPGGVETFDAVIGADGVRSKVRSLLSDIDGLEETGRTAWRRTRRSVEPSPVTQVVLAADEHRVAYPISSGTNEVWVRDDDAAAPGAEWSPWPVLFVRPKTRWSIGRVALVGDAAHAMPPYAAQGGAMALEDAAVIASTLVGADDPATAFALYERTRRPRTTRILGLTESNRRIYHMTGALRLARNVAMTLTPQTVLQQRMAFVYAWTPPAIRSN